MGNSRVGALQSISLHVIMNANPLTHQAPLNKPFIPKNNLPLLEDYSVDPPE